MRVRAVLESTELGMTSTAPPRISTEVLRHVTSVTSPVTPPTVM